jgi:signal transduction histidine kinase
VRLEVEDDGPGIAPDVRDKLFEPFVTTKPVGEGTGLGLAVCRGLVEAVGGTITVDPNAVELAGETAGEVAGVGAAKSVRKGARFVIELPSAS